MTLKDRIAAEMVAAMKDRNKVRVAAIRLIRDGIQKTEIAEKTELDDPGVARVLARLTRQREESIRAFEAGRREDLAGREKEELAIVREFMPPAMGGEELSALVAAAISEAAALAPADLGKVMKALKGRYEGRAGGKEVSEEAKRQLAKLSGS
ncbi:MAG TPA: GatB/YqeY domain-containing protein [bacterium]|nr:GatB/YqeY domain-containing protein [bacterium]